MTNAERIRTMTEEELWVWLDDLGNVCVHGYYNGDHARCKKYISCRECWKDWLVEEADGADCSDGSDESKKQGDER